MSDEPIFVPILPPGKMIDVSVEMLAPSKAGSYYIQQ